MKLCWEARKFEDVLYKQNITTITMDEDYYYDKTPIIKKIPV